VTRTYFLHTYSMYSVRTSTHMCTGSRAAARGHRTRNHAVTSLMGFRYSHFVCKSELIFLFLFIFIPQLITKSNKQYMQT